MWIFESLVERCVKSIKKLFFKLLLEFPTSTFENLLHLASLAYNQREHSSLHGFSPIEAHWDSHISSIVVRKTLAKFKRKQKKLVNIFSQKPQNIFKVHDAVLLKKRKRQFHRTGAVFHPHFETELRHVTAVDKKCLPFTYSISGFPLKRKFYFWELHRVSNLYGKVKASAPSSESKIYVSGAVLDNNPILRSGNSLVNRGSYSYIIERRGRREKVTAQDLYYIKRTLGDVLIYGSFFNKPQNHHLKV